MKISECSIEQYEKNLKKAKKFFDPNNFGPNDFGPNDFGQCLNKEKKLLKKINKDTDVVFIYGIEFGIYYLSLKKWLDENKNRQLIFLEDDLSEIDKFLKTNIAKSVLENKQVKIYFYFFLENNFDFILKKIAWETILLKYEILASPLYLERKKAKFFEIKKKLLNAIYAVHLIYSDYSDFGSIYLKNVFQNLLNTKKIKLINSLKKSFFKDIPAIICGAGPSLEKNISLLDDLKDKALIFAGGTALNILNKNDIMPHFAASIDRQSPHDKFKESKSFYIPFFLQMQMSHQNYSLIHGDKILIPSYGAYGLEDWIYEELGLGKKDSFEIGWTVGTALISIAKSLGCNPIIFLGMDFCYEKEKYSIKVAKDKTPCEPIEVLDIHNKVVFSQKDWILARDWIEDFVKEAMHKELPYVGS